MILYKWHNITAPETSNVQMSINHSTCLKKVTGSHTHYDSGTNGTRHILNTIVLLITMGKCLTYIFKKYP